MSSGETLEQAKSIISPIDVRPTRRLLQLRQEAWGEWLHSKLSFPLFKGFWSEMVSWKREECLLGSSSSLSKPSSGKTLRTKRDINVTPEDLPGFFGAYIATRTRRYNAYLERVQSSASVSRILSRTRESSLHSKTA